MKHIFLICIFFLASISGKAQDSTALLNHEIGFNTVSLIKQIISNNPSAVLGQLPYDIFYNLYYKNIIGLRVGVGYSNSHNETPITGQPEPRRTDQKSFNLRSGISYNFVRTKKIEFNTFGDFILTQGLVQTVNTFTIRPQFSPVQTVTTKSGDYLEGFGGAIGVGVKYNIIKHLSVYAEVPIVFITEKTTSEFTTTDERAIFEAPVSTKNSATRIILPTTIYLVLKF